MAIARIRGETGPGTRVPAAQVPDDLGQRLPLDILHGVVVGVALTADAEDRYDVGMVQAGRGLRFILEPLQLPGIQRGGKRQYLQRHPAAEGNLLRFVHHAHATAADLAHQAEVAEGAEFGQVFQGNQRPRSSRTPKTGGRVSQEFQDRQAGLQGLRHLGKSGHQLLRVRPGPDFQSREEFLQDADHLGGRLERHRERHTGTHTNSSACSSCLS